MLSAGCMHSTLFFPGFSELAFELLVLSYSIVHNLPQLYMHAVIFSSLELFFFLSFCCSRRHLSRCKHFNNGPRSQAPVCLNFVDYTDLVVNGKMFFHPEWKFRKWGWLELILVIPYTEMNQSCITTSVPIEEYFTQSLKKLNKYLSELHCNI